MKHSIWSYILVMAVTTYLIRVIPLTLIRKQIRNRTIRSFLYYVPYVTLAVMTFPAIMNDTPTIWSGLAALAVGVALALSGRDLMIVAIACCAVVFVVEMFV